MGLVVTVFAICFSATIVPIYKVLEKVKPSFEKKSKGFIY
jgi:hypothetical protein